jgi:hypothetical protein
MVSDIFCPQEDGTRRYHDGHLTNTLGMAEDAGVCYEQATSLRQRPRGVDDAQSWLTSV